MKSVVGRDLETRFERLAALLAQQPFEDETERKFGAKWSELVDQYEAAHPDAVPPLLRYRADLTSEAVWPKGWTR